MRIQQLTGFVGLEKNVLLDWDRILTILIVYLIISIIFLIVFLWRLPFRINTCVCTVA